MNEGHDGTKLGQWVPLPNPDGYKPNRTLEMNDKYHLQMQQQMQQQQGPITEREVSITDRLKIIVNLIDEANIAATSIKEKVFGPFISLDALQVQGEQKSPEGIIYSLDDAEGGMCKLLKSLDSISERL